MANTKPQKAFFNKVAIARQLLKEKSEEILKQYLLVVDEARASGDYETAAKALQWLIEHMPSDETGERMVEVSVDKKQQEVAPANSGPQIRIGIAVGGLGQKSMPDPKKPKELSKPVIEIVDAE